MKIILEPSVHIFSKPSFVEVPIFPIPEDGDDAAKIGAFAAKVCYRSRGKEGRANEVNQAHIMASRHGRILEHINVGLYITGVSRALGNELITHKAGVTVSQESTRYVEQDDGGYVLEPWIAQIAEDLIKDGRIPSECLENPISIPVDFEAQRGWQNRMMILKGQLIAAYRSFDIYSAQVERIQAENPLNLEGVDLRKFARGKARNVLPLGLETSLVMTGNLRAFRHFIEMRSAPDAEEEIRRLTLYIFARLSREFPLYFRDYDTNTVRGWPHFTTELRKI